MAQEQIELVVNSRQAFSALQELNKGISQTEGGIEGANTKLQTSFDKLSTFIVQAQDKATKAAIKHVDAVEKMSSAYGRLPLEKLTAQLEQEIKKINESSLSIEVKTKLVDSLTASYQKMMTVEQAAAQSSVSANRAGAMALKEVENGLSNNTRGAAMFLTQVLGLGPVMQAAFPVIGAVAFLGVLVSLGEEVNNFVKSIKEAPEKIHGAFQELSASSRLANNELAVTNDRLANSIAKMEHRPQNMLKLALDEAAVSSDKLAQSLDKRFSSLYKLVKENDVGMLRQALGEGDVSFIAEKLGGKTGFGGNRAELEKLRKSNSEYEQGATSLDDLTRRKKTSTDNLDAFYAKKQREYDSIVSGLDAWEKSGDLQKNFNPLLGTLMKGAGIDVPTGPNDITAAKELAQGVSNELGSRRNEIKGTALESRLNQNNERLKGQEEYRKTVERLDHEIAQAQSGELSGLAKLDAAHKERQRQLLNEGLLTQKQIDLHTGLEAKLDKLHAQEVENDTIEKARKAKATDYTVAQLAAESKLRLEEENFQQARRGSEFGTSDINHRYTTTVAGEMIRHDARLEAIAAMKEEDQSNARKIEDQTHSNALAEAENKLRNDGLELTRKDAELKRIIHQDEVNHQQKLLDIQTAAENKYITSQSRHAQQMRSILSGRHQSTAEQIAGVQSDTSAQEWSLSNTYSNTAAALAEKIRQDESEKAKATAEHRDKDAEEQEKRIRSLKDEADKAQLDHAQALIDVRLAAEEKIAQLQMKQFEEIQTKTEGLLHTLFTNPKSFGEQFKTTLRDAALKPIEQKLSGGISTEIYKLLHGGQLPGDNTTLAEMKGLAKGPDGTSLRVWVTNTDAGVLGGTSGYGFIPGIGAVSGSGSGSSAGVSLSQLMNLPISHPMNPLSNGNVFGNGGHVFAPFGVGTSGKPSYQATSESISFPSDATPSDGIVFVGGERRGAINNNKVDLGGGIQETPNHSSQGSSNSPIGILNKTLGGGYKKGSTQPNIFKNLKNTDWGFKDTTEVDPNTGEKTGHGALRGGVAGEAITAGGMYLAQRGLLGQDRGTTAGIFEGTIGGAAVGFEYGGPIGAAIGAFAGFGIGLGEKLAGVESPENEAKRLVKQRYGLSIDTSTAQQIVSIANSKYGKKVSVAVMSPEVRSMLELYGAATGQKMPMSAVTPHGGSISEQNGRLSQDASYRFGAAYSYQSNLPVSGGLATTSYPSTSGNQPMNLQINVNGKGAGDFLAGSVVTPDYVQAQWQTAQSGSNGRMQSSAMLQYPGLVV